MPAGSQLYHTTQALLEVLTSHFPGPPSHRDLFNHCFSNRVAVQPSAEHPDGWSLYSLEMTDADCLQPNPPSFYLDLLVVWRGLQRPYMLATDSFSILLDGPGLHSLTITSLYPEGGGALSDLQMSRLRVHDPEGVRRGLLPRLIKMMSRGYRLPEGPEGEDLRVLCHRLLATDPSASLESILRHTTATGGLPHLRAILHLQQLYTEERLMSMLKHWSQHDCGFRGLQEILTACSTCRYVPDEVGAAYLGSVTSCWREAPPF